jgi:hypothetical protein
MALACQHTALRAEQIGCDGRAVFVRLSCWVVLALPARGREGKRVLVSSRLSCSCRSDQTEERIQATEIVRKAAPLHIYAIATRRPRETKNGDVAQ